MKLLIINPIKGVLETLERGPDESRETWRKRQFRVLCTYRKLGIHVYCKKST